MPSGTEVGAHKVKIVGQERGGVIAEEGNSRGGVTGGGTMRLE